MEEPNRRAPNLVNEEEEGRPLSARATKPSQVVDIWKRSEGNTKENVAGQVSGLQKGGRRD